MKKRAIGQSGWLWTSLASVVAFIYFFPVLFIILTAFRSRSDTLATPPKWFFTPTFENFYHIFFRSMANSTEYVACLLYTSPSPRDGLLSRMPSYA